MNIRALEASDIEQIREIHAKHFSHEFNFPDFLHNFLCAFVVDDDQGKIISAGGVRAIAEVVIVTDKDYPIRPRRSALYQILDVSEFISKKADFGELHAFVQGDNWQRHLRRIGFLPTKGKALVLEF